MRRLFLGTVIATVALGAGTASAAAPRIAYLDFTASGDALFTVRPDGTHVHQVTHFDVGFLGGPSWDPKQKRLVFARSNSAPSNLYTIRTNGTHLHKIPHTKAALDPSWSPDGKRIAYTVENSSSDKFAIYVIGVNGKHRKRLTAFKQNIAPDWSPSGKSIVYASSDGIVRMRSNGHHKQVVSSSGEEPAWSPNGKRIAFQDTASNPVAVHDIYTIKVNGTGKKNITGSRPGTSCPEFPDECNRDDEWPSWGPKGKRVLFDEMSSGNGDAGIFTVAPGSTTFKQVTTSGDNADWR